LGVKKGKKVMEITELGYMGSHRVSTSGRGGVKKSLAESSTHLMECRDTEKPRGHLDITTLRPPYTLLTGQPPLALAIGTFGIEVYRVQ
jgi:hypothetical protein